MGDRWTLSAFGDEIAVDLEEQLAVLQSLQVECLELRSAWGVSVVDLTAEQRGRAARLLREAGIRVSAIASPVGKTSIDDDFEGDLNNLDAALAAADQFDTELVRVFSFYVDGRYDESRDEVLRRMAALAQRAEARGVTLVHENESYIYGDVPERCRDLVESVGSPALRIAFDPANFVQVGVRPFAQGWPLLEELVAHFHVKDAVAVERDEPYPARVLEGRLMLSVRPPGEGEGELPELLRALARSEYRGFLTVEPHLRLLRPDLDGAGCLRIAVTALRGLLGEVDSRREVER